MLVPNRVSSLWMRRMSGSVKLVEPSPTIAAEPSGFSRSPITACAALAPEVSISLSAPPGNSAANCSPTGPAVGSSVLCAPSCPASARRPADGSIPAIVAPIARANSTASSPTGPRPETISTSRPLTPSRLKG